jgi:glutathione S-transferase
LAHPKRASHSKEDEKNTMKILYSPASPYSAKVRMAARYAGLDAEAVLTDTNAAPAELVDNNPLGKIPTLITDEGQPVYDSRAIMQYHRPRRRQADLPAQRGKAD